MRDEKTRLSYWFPLIQAAGLPVPRTEIIPLSDEDVPEIGAYFRASRSPSPLDRLESSIRAAGEKFGFPCFLRTDYTSAKHGWERTCYVEDPSKIARHVHGIWEFSECADMIGLPTDVWVVRELLKTKPAFTAFRGMPITQEFRFFVRDGNVEHVQPYWPPDSIKNPSTDDWLMKLADISALRDGERRSLETMTLVVNSAVPGYWSVDWLWTTDRGWVLIDMAEGDRSFRWG